MMSKLPIFHFALTFCLLISLVDKGRSSTLFDRHNMTLAVKAYEEKARDQWLFDYPAQVWPPTHIFLFALCKIIQLPVGQINDPSFWETLHILLRSSQELLYLGLRPLMGFLS